MSSHQKAYFILPNTDIAPNTLIKLCQIVPSIREAHRAISPPQPIPAASATTGVKTDYTLSISSTQNIRVGPVAHFLAQLGSPVSGALELERSKKKSSTWTFKTLETTSFEPTLEYIHTSISSAAAKQALKKTMKNPLVRNAVYMITALKIARGASYSTSTSRSSDTKSTLTVDANALAGVPVSAGPQAGIKETAGESEDMGHCSDFVWAVRTRRIRLGGLDVRVKVGDVYGGDLHGYGEGSGEGDDDDFGGVDGSDEEEVVEVEKGELEAFDLGVGLGVGDQLEGFVKKVVVDEGGEQCAVLW
ncbi:hypothetical protein CC80DRAFT_592177 [Byssothecium circinans]|uniref:Uncharacterized protein n=1 Tax=Byssothecium circinans TaxID=147558 RepID=A0A6A5U1J2_9PLEO|nr:hypothetical protein CC80DRAFT_592177 [Byssothecium circinans]